MRRATRIAILLVGISPLAAAGQERPRSGPTTARAEVLVLGVFHMANPGRDVFNMQVDDVLTPKRQAEIAQVVAALARFRPTRIALERNAGDSRITKDYADYVAGRHELTRNEIEQLGFRLGKQLGHQTVYPVDADGEFPFPRLINYAKAAGRADALNRLMTETGAMVKAQNEYLATHSVLDMLLAMNSDSASAGGVGAYFELARFGEPGDWAGPDLVADWFRRNLRIYGNVTSLIQSPEERVLVIFGAGHLGWLQFAFGNTPGMRLRKLEEFVK